MPIYLIIYGKKKIKVPNEAESKVPILQNTLLCCYTRHTLGEQIVQVAALRARTTHIYNIQINYLH